MYLFRGQGEDIENGARTISEDIMAQFMLKLIRHQSTDLRNSAKPKQNENTKKNHTQVYHKNV